MRLNTRNSWGKVEMEEDLWVKKCETSINPLSKDLRGTKCGRLGL